MKKNILSFVLIFSLALISFNAFAADGDLIVNGNVGIGTTSPATKLDVNGTVSATNMNVSGNVGIGTTTPAAKLDVSGDIRLGNSNATCTAANEGAMRYNNSLKFMQFCDGTNWRLNERQLVTIDLQVANTNDDICIKSDGSVWSVSDSGAIGYSSSTSKKRGGGLRWRGLNIPEGAEIITAYVKLTARSTDSGTTVNAYITGEKTGTPAAFSDITDYQVRRGTVVGGPNDSNITGTQIAWNNLGAWTLNNQYQTPDLKNIIQEIVNTMSITDLVLFIDDHNARGTQSDGRYRRYYNYAASTTQSAKLHIEYKY